MLYSLYLSNGSRLWNNFTGFTWLVGSSCKTDPLVANIVESSYKALALGHGHNVILVITHSPTQHHYTFTQYCLLIWHIMINTIILVTDSIIIQCLDYTYSNVYRSLDAAFISISSRSIAWSVRAIHWLEKEREWVTEQVSEYVREWASEWVSDWASEWVCERVGEWSEWVWVSEWEWVSK